MEMDDRVMSESSMRGCRGNGRSVFFIINLQVTQGPDVVPGLDFVANWGNLEDIGLFPDQQRD
jgi:hypothetical protein